MDKKHFNVMEEITEGAEVFGREEAILLREVQQAHPEWIAITEPMGEYTGTERMPYFGAILKKEGISALKNWKKNHENLD